MSPLFAKLNLKDQKTIHVLNAPNSFEPELVKLEGVKVQRRAASRLDFGIAFAITETELNRLSSDLVSAAQGDAVLWIAYPKGTSKRYRCEFNRDTGWKVLGDAGYEPVRMVAIDEDWSALRFRKVENIKAMTRNPTGAISKAGRKKTRARKR